jgi:hypothetical protein
METTTNPLANIPTPAGAVRLEDWELGRTSADGMPNVDRGFTGTARIVELCDERVEVEVTGLQRMGPAVSGRGPLGDSGASCGSPSNSGSISRVLVLNPSC